MLKDAVRGGTVELDIVSAGQQQSTPRSVVKTLSIFASTAATPATPVRPERKSGSQVLELPQHQHGLGVTVIATNDRTGRQLVVVSSIRDEGAVPSYGGLEAGDAILTINGLTLVDQTATEITRRLQAAIGPNQLQDKQVVVDTQGSSLGISFIQDAKGSIRVAAIVPGSPADNGRIKEGMQVISLNSEVVTSVQQVKRMVLRLSRGHESMKFHFREGTVILEVYPQADVSSEKSPPCK